MGEIDFLIRVMFWTILAIMLVVLYMLKQLTQHQKHLENIDKNISKMVRKTLKDEEMILEDVEELKAEYERDHKKKSSSKKK